MGKRGRVINIRVTALLVVGAVVAAAALTLAGPPDGPGPVAAAKRTVTAEPEGLVFTPDKLTIEEGDTVVVHHPAGSQYHDIKWDDRTAACPNQPTQNEWTCERRFTKPGTFKAVCTVHEATMTLTVKVLAGPTPKPPPATPKPTPKPTKKPTPPPPDPTPDPTVEPTPTAPATMSPTTSPTQAASPSPVASSASTPVPASTGAGGSDGAGPLLLLLGLLIAGAVGGAALVRRRASAPGRSAEE